MGFELKRVDHGWREILKWSKERGAYAKAGVLGEGSHAKPREDGDSLSNVELAVIHEFGAPKAGIPERSFVRASFELHRPEYLLMLKRFITSALLRRETLVKALSVIGQAMASDMKKLITTEGGHPVPLAPATVARKGSSVPLLDTGQLVNSITYVVVDPSKAEHWGSPPAAAHGHAAPAPAKGGHGGGGHGH